jgi:hypothetical protein
VAQKSPAKKNRNKNGILAFVSFGESTSIKEQFSRKIEVHSIKITL